MEDFWFYVKLGYNHVLDFGAYDHILFLMALAIPFTFKLWKKVLLLATIFTVAHCFSLYLSAFGLVTMDVGLIEFLIPVTILCTALFNLYFAIMKTESKNITLHIFATAFFGLVHGFGFSNYFKMLMAEEEEKLQPLLGFAAGIEVAQVLIVFLVLALAFLCINIIKMKSVIFTVITSILIVLITIPMLIETFPW